MERVLRQDRRLTARWERVDCASFDRGRQMDELRMVPAESKTKLNKCMLAPDNTFFLAV